MVVGGFPDPFIKGSESFYKKWRRTHLDIILHQDLIQLEEVRHIKAIETLVELLRSRVGSPVSYTSLAEDLQFSSHTIKKWLFILEKLQIIFKVMPYHKNIVRSILKTPKYYFYDIAAVKGDEGTRFENLVALSLLKECSFITDTCGDETSLCYLKTKNGQEVDFFVQREDRTSLIEAKLSDTSISKSVYFFKKIFPNTTAIQLVKNLQKNFSVPDGITVTQAASWLSTLKI